MPTRKRSKNTIRNRKTRRSMRTMRPTRPMRHLNSTKHLSSPLGYFGSIQINRRSDNNGFDFIFDLVKKIRGGAKLKESFESIRLVNDVMSYATRSIARNIQKNLNEENINMNNNDNYTSNFIRKYKPMGKGPNEYYVVNNPNQGNHFIEFYDFYKKKYRIHISMFMESTDPDFLLQSTNREHDTRYHITEDKDPSNKQHFNLEWHIQLDTNENNFYLRCNLLNPKRNDSIDQKIAKEIIQYINEALHLPENRISAVNIPREVMYENDSKYWIILAKHDVNSVSELTGDTSTEHTMHGINMNKILNAGGSYSKVSIFNQAVNTATAQYNTIINELIRENEDDPDVKKNNEKKSQKKTLKESLNKVLFTENQQDHFFEILNKKQAELKAEELKLAYLQAELAKLQPNEKDGGRSQSDDDDWMDAPLPEITLKTNEMILKEKISKLEQEISESNKKIEKLKQDIFNIIELNTEMQDDALKLFKQFNTQNTQLKDKAKSSTKKKGKN
jgi:hypothetical protein